jgi:hypothetical protein
MKSELIFPDTFFTIRSYLATMRKQGHSLFECLVSTFNGQPMQPRVAWVGSCGAE